MKIGYTYHGYNNIVSGVGKYIYYLHTHLKKINKIELLTRYAKNIYFKNELKYKKEFLPNWNFKGKQTLEIFLQDIYLKRSLKKNDYDIIHHTGEDENVYSWLKGKTPVIITIHDMIPELYYSHKKNEKRKKERATSIRKANQIICISEHTKNDLIKLFPETPLDKITVIHHGIESITAQYTPNTHGDYLLFVGGRRRYKNFDFFLKAVAPLLLHNNIKLICTGSKFSESETKLITMYGLRELVINRGFVSDNELQNLYYHAKCFVFPSLYEGFGFPILEAFSNECPICISNRSCFPEIAGDAALYFDPENENSIRNSIRIVLENDKLRNEIIQKGKAKLKSFTWEKAAEKTYQVYLKALRLNTITSKNNQSPLHS
jgi:glycosyltransferase involved in cell wall biosynthesis